MFFVTQIVAAHHFGPVWIEIATVKNPICNPMPVAWTWSAHWSAQCKFVYSILLALAITTAATATRTTLGVVKLYNKLCVHLQCRMQLQLKL